MQRNANNDVMYLRRVMMKIAKGIHFYINLRNYNSVILREIKAYDSCERSIHAIDTLFSSVERYGEKHHRDTFHVEKITGGRLHLYVIDEVAKAFDVVQDVTCFAFNVAGLINKEIGKYRNLTDFEMQAAADFGKFVSTEFSEEDYSEETSIGYVANFAAKLQAVTRVGRISVSEDIYSEINDSDRIYHKVFDPSLKKYGQNCYYTAEVSDLMTLFEVRQGDVDDVIRYANEVNLSEIRRKSVAGRIDFGLLSRTDCVEMEGIPLYADIRGFTQKFDSDDDNLLEMVNKTVRTLGTMYRCTKNNNGVHIQFQGDRELALFYNNSDDNPCFQDAVVAALRMIDEIKDPDFHIGVGADFGKIYAAKVRAREEKDKLLLGEAVIQAEIMEDKHAEQDQIAITKEVYDGLKQQNSVLAGIFKKNGKVYTTPLGYEDYLNRAETIRLRENTKNKTYNPAWRSW